MDTIQELEQKFRQSVAIYNSQQLSVQEQQEFSNMLQNLINFKEKAITELHSIDMLEKDVDE